MTDDETTRAQATGSEPPLEGDETGADWANTGGPAGGESDEASGAWTSGRPAGARASATAQHWLAELQTIIDNLTKESAPVIREVGAKAAEIAAIAADRAGPFAMRAADVTVQASARMAERSRQLAAELRRPVPGEGDSVAGATESGGERAADGPAGPAAGATPDAPEPPDTTAPQGPTV